MNESKDSPIDHTPQSETPDNSLYSAIFLQKLSVITFGVLLAGLLIVILKLGQAVLQPLFIAIFIAYLIIPVRDWLVQKGVPSLLAAIVILVVVLGILVGVGILVFSVIQGLIKDWESTYEPALNRLIRDIVNMLPFQVETLDAKTLGDRLLPQTSLETAIGQIAEMFSGLAVIFVYLVFVAAERTSLPQRVARALGQKQGDRVLGMFKSINQAITEYLAIKTFIGFVAALLSMFVLYIFGVKYWQIWGLLIFLLNYIPYLGSLVATVMPIMLAFLDVNIHWWQAIVIAMCLIGIQQAFGTFIEPKIAGRRLGVSPILVILSLAFWGALWGIPGMILAVPILMIIKIILENIDETKSLAILMSNE